MAGIIIIVLVGAALAYGIYRLTGVLRRGVQVVREISDAIQDGEAEAQNTPKSLSAMDRLLLPKIKQQFPEYDVQLMQRRAEQDALRYYHSLQQRRVLFGEKDGIRSFLQEMEQQVRLDTVRRTEVLVHRSALSGYESGGSHCFVIYQAACQYVGSHGLVQTKLQLRYIAAEHADLEKNIQVYNCPNCGAPISSIGQKRCEYCDTVLNPAAVLSWMLFDIQEIR